MLLHSLEASSWSYDRSMLCKKEFAVFLVWTQKRACQNAMTFLCSLVSNIVQEYHWVVAHDGSEDWKRRVFQESSSKSTRNLMCWTPGSHWVCSLFAVIGWPDKTPDVHAFYPTSLLGTVHIILFFWVAHMVMLRMKLTGEWITFQGGTSECWCNMLEL